MHIPVLLHESITALDLHEGEVIVDGTFGGGGHSKAILESLKNKCTLICVDLDEGAQERFEKSFRDTPAIFVHDNYRNAKQILEKSGVQKVNKVLLDIGTSSFQLDDDTRGFSFMSDTPLKMTLSQSGSHTGFNAFDIVNQWGESSIADIIFYYGE